MNTHREQTSRADRRAIPQRRTRVANAVRWLGAVAALGPGAALIGAACASAGTSVGTGPLELAVQAGTPAPSVDVLAKGAKPVAPASPAPPSILACRCPPRASQLGGSRWDPQGPALQGFGPGYQKDGVCEDAQTDLPRRFRLDGMVTADGQPIRGARVEPGRLVGAKSWVGVRLRAALDCTKGAALETEARIVAVKRDPAGASRSLYQVEVLDPATKGWLPLCNRRDHDGSEGEILATPFAGEWDSHGEFHDTPRTLTFACTTAAAAKCAQWGYGPWDTPGNDDTGKPVPRREAHQACIRMARADYCGNGQSWTKLGTEINIWDSAGLREKAAPRAGAGFEAAWSPAGAVCVHHTRHPEMLPQVQCAPQCDSAEEATALAARRKLLLFDESQLPAAPARTRSASR